MNYRQKIAEIIKTDVLTKKEIEDSIEKPKDLSNGDYAIPCFKFAKKLSKNPNEIAQNLLNTIEDDEKIFDEIVNINGFLNFKVNKQKIIDSVINEIILKNEIYGEDGSGKGQTVCIDYSSINIAKPFHIGHLLSTVIGGALYKVYKKLGYNVIGINHLGDWGTQFGAMIVAFKRWGNEDEISENGIKALSKYYAQFHIEERREQEEIAKKDKAKNEEIEKIDAPIRIEARKWFKKIEDKDEEATELFNRFKKITLQEIDKIYKRLNVQFDSYDGESFYNDKMEPIVEELREKGILKSSRGAEIVEFLDEQNNEKMPPCIVKRNDGASLYITRDLAAVFYRKRTYNFKKCLYVVAYQQNLHFNQLFEIVKMMGNDWTSDLRHVAFGMVSLETGAMSTRQGNVVLLEDVLNTSTSRCLAVIEEKNKDLKNKEKIAEQIGVGAVIFAALKNSRIKDMVFNYDKMIAFEGETGPYIQYTHARCASIIKKARYFDSDISTYPSINNSDGYELCVTLSEYTEILHQVVDKDEPSILARYIIDVSKLFNKFYTNNKILSDDENEKNERVLLTMAVKEVIRDGMKLLGIECPSSM